MKTITLLSTIFFLSIIVSGPVQAANPKVEAINVAIQQLDETANDYVARGDMRGVFARVYWRVTKEFRDWIVAGNFQDADSVATMVIEFHQLYRQALAQYEQQLPETNPAWALSFDQHDRPEIKPTVQLLLGLNAHIVTDLPVTLAKVWPTLTNTRKLERDYFLMNELFKKIIPDLFRILKQLNHLFEQSGFNIFPFQKTKEAIVWSSVKAMRQDAFEDGLRLARTRPGTLEREQLLRELNDKGIRQGQVFLKMEPFIPYRIR